MQHTLRAWRSPQVAGSFCLQCLTTWVRPFRTGSPGWAENKRNIWNEYERYVIWFTVWPGAKHMLCMPTTSRYYCTPKGLVYIDRSWFGPKPRLFLGTPRTLSAVKASVPPCQIAKRLTEVATVEMKWRNPIGQSVLFDWQVRSVYRLPK